MKTMLKKIVALAAIACMLISSVSVNAATKNYSQTALSRTVITREPGAQGFVALRNVNGKVKWTSSNTSVVSLVYQTPLYTERPYTGKISEVDFYCKKVLRFCNHFPKAPVFYLQKQFYQPFQGTLSEWFSLHLFLIFL